MLFRSIANTYAYELFAGAVARAREIGITNAPDVVDGHLSPSMLPGWGAEIDWAFVKSRTVGEY